MLKIAWIKINNLKDGCVTDSAPNISYALESDLPGESLKNALITSGEWKIQTNDQINNLYGGELRPFTTYTVHITAYGTSGEVAQGSASFSTGRLDTPWQAQWITDAGYDFPDKVSPVPMSFRRIFSITKPVRRAWINASALGVYELILNGEKVGKDYFAPGFTSYEHHIQYQSYEVKTQLNNHNILTAVVAGGWAAGAFNYKRKSKMRMAASKFLAPIRHGKSLKTDRIVWQNGMMEKPMMQL